MIQLDKCILRIRVTTTTGTGLSVISVVKWKNRHVYVRIGFMCWKIMILLLSINVRMNKKRVIQFNLICESSDDG